MPSSPRVSAGLLMYRGRPPALEVFLAHPGGPFFAKKDAGAWTLPKGELEPEEDAQQTALREFREEIGLPVASELIELGSVTQKGGKRVLAWAFSGDAPDDFVPNSNAFELEWPPRSGRKRRFPEIDRAGFFGLEQARTKLNPAQVPFLERLVAHLTVGRPRS